MENLTNTSETRRINILINKARYISLNSIYSHLNTVFVFHKILIKIPFFSTQKITDNFN